ncbi:MAG: hypothetical protein HY717_16730 [Planctomycetes bacterium]|nr:hypothetical protein [Planctomycetota bacterium]
MPRSASCNSFQLRALTSISGDLYCRLNSLRQRLEERLKIPISEPELLDYICEKAIEKLEDWEARRPPR